MRELENVIERAVVLGGRSPWVERQHLATLDAPSPLVDGDRIEGLLGAEVTLDEVERELIVQALARVRGNVTQAAKLLGLSRRTLQYRMGKHEVAR